MGKKEWRKFLGPWSWGIILILLNRMFYPPSRYYIMGIVLMVASILLSIWNIWGQYRRSQGMDRACRLMIILTVLFVILESVIILI